MGKPHLVHNDDHTERTAARQVLANAIAKRDRRRLGAKVVMADEIGEWPQQFLQLHRHYVAQLAALDWLVKQDIVPQQGDGGPTPAGTVVFNVQYAPQVLMREVQSDSHPSRIKWQQAFTALCLDADSELPE